MTYPFSNATVYREIDRKDWGEGPWDNEPDYKSWTHEGFPCAIVRNWSGALCGYVQVPLTHPLAYVRYMDVGVEVHGGLTFGERTEEGTWFGFDCAHSWDKIPGLERNAYRDHDTPYRDFSFVTAEVNRLADQLKAKDTPSND